MSQNDACGCNIYECCPRCNPAAFRGRDFISDEAAAHPEPEIIPAGKVEETLAQALADAAANFRVALEEHEAAEYHEKSTNTALNEALSKLEEAEKHLTDYLTKKETHHEQT